MSHFAVPPSGPTLLEYVPDGGIRAAASPGKLTQNLRFFWGGNFCKWLYKLLSLPLVLLLLSAQQLPQGFVYEKRTLPGPVSIHILEVDPHYVQIAPVHASPYILSRETPSSIAKRKGAVAAVNGGFFRMEGKYEGSSSGILKIAGELLSSPRFTRAAIGWMDGGKKVLIDRLGMQAELKGEALSLPIDGINQPEASDKAILYTSGFFSSTLASPESKEIVIDKEGRVQSITYEGDSPIPAGGFVYAIGRSHSAQIQLGSYLTPSIQILPELDTKKMKLWNSMPNIVGGAPLLIFKGKKISDYTCEKTRPSFLTSRHPRTAIGIKPNGHWVFVIVDGRQPDLSIGMTVQELADFLFSLGCTDALNLDGGGSSTLFLNGCAMNSISCDEEEEGSGEERPVSDAILLWERDE